MLADPMLDHEPLLSACWLEQAPGLKTRKVDAGNWSSLFAGRIGRDTSPPPQLGQRPLSLVSVHSRQYVHSKLQIIASGSAGGRSLLQHSQLGRISNMSLPSLPALPADVWESSNDPGASRTAVKEDVASRHR